MAIPYSSKNNLVFLKGQEWIHETARFGNINNFLINQQEVNWKRFAQNELQILRSNNKKYIFSLMFKFLEQNYDLSNLFKICSYFKKPFVMTFN